MKTSTGFGPGGATAEDVALMRQTVGAHDGREGLRRNSHAAKTYGKWWLQARRRIGASASVRIIVGIGR